MDQKPHEFSFTAVLFIEHAYFVLTVSITTYKYLSFEFIRTPFMLFSYSFYHTLNKFNNRIFIHMSCFMLSTKNKRKHSQTLYRCKAGKLKKRATYFFNKKNVMSIMV